MCQCSIFILTLVLENNVLLYRIQDAAQEKRDVDAIAR